MSESATTWHVHQGNVFDVLPTLPDASVDCCVTSPPYWGLRDYGTASWEGGDAACAHRVGGQVQDAKAPGAITTGVRPGVDASMCRECGARRVDAQLGLEPTPAEYVENMVRVFREVRRVLKDDGTLWLNLGDSYAGSWGAQSRQGDTGQMSGRSVISAQQIAAAAKRDRCTGSLTNTPGLKAKDLCGIPWRVAFALQADGWYLRSDLIWHKPNPMPESVTDRPTKAHEYLFLMSKSERYYYDKDAIADPATNAGKVLDYPGDQKANDTDDVMQATRPKGREITVAALRNKRTVWSICSEPYAGAHFAVMPTALVKPCVLAGCRKGGAVLDPFAGSGTVLQVADEHGCSSIGVELNPKYVEMIVARMNAATQQTRLAW